MEPIFEVLLTRPPRGSRRILTVLYRQLRDVITAGRPTPGLRMPATRALATMAGVSRNTAMSAYELLLAEGHLGARQGAGTFVAATLARRSRASAPTATLTHELNATWRHAASAPAARFGRDSIFDRDIPINANFHSAFSAA